MARRTPLYDAHRALGARFVEFAGWEMPVSYTSATAEHRAVREHCGLFDVSHMGEIEVRGPGAAALCGELTVNDVHRLRIGDGQYTLLCNEQGGVLDDLILFRLGPERFLMVVNAANTTSDLAWVEAHGRRGAEVSDRSPELALLALQGPDSEVALRRLTPFDLAALRPFTASETTVAGHHAVVSRTGYTGEDGFEVMVGAEEAGEVWDATLEVIRRRGGSPAGLAARDTLRLEAGLPLCGTDMDASTSPFEAGLAWVVKLGKGDFVGRAALERQQRQGVPRRLAGLVMDEPAIPRHGCPVWRDDARVGTVTSGMMSATLNSFIGLAYLSTGADRPGTSIAVEIRGRRVPGHVVARPFYRRVQQ
jgi:aminomethyltransferase